MERVLRWGLGLVLIAAIGATAFFVFHHPPMRLMPAPLLFRMGGADLVELAPALRDGSEIEIFYATNRLPVGPRDNRVYTVAPDTRLHVGKAELRIGEEGSTLDQMLEWTFGADQGDRPFIHLQRLRESGTLGWRSGADAAAEWFAEIDALLAASPDRDILLYIHGANTTVERAAGQASQLRHFTGRNSVVVLFAWPTAENFLRYSRDIDAALGAAPKVAELIALLTENTSAEFVNVFTYSAGATVGSDALAIAARDEPVAAARIAEVYHAAPDADFRAFVDDMIAYSGTVGRVTTAVNFGDSALRLAGAVNRASRAGRPDLAELAPDAAEWLLEATGSDGIEVVQVHPETMPDLAATSHTFWYDDPWVSNDVLATLLFNLPPDLRGLERVESQSGNAYWTFPPDYPDRMPALVQSVRALIDQGATERRSSSP